MKEKSGNTESSFLDPFTMNLFDKRDAFPFSIVKMPQFMSNIPSKLFYASYGVEYLKIATETSTKTSFINHCSTLIFKMINKGGNVNTISKTLSKTLGRYFETFSKFFATSSELFKFICT